MKFSYMGFSQKKLVEYKLDLVDAAILRYFIDFKDSGKMVLEIHNEKPFYWVKYETLIEDNPILNIKSNDSIRRRFKKLADANILEHFHKKKGGSYSFYGVGENYKYLIADGTTQKSEGATEKSDPYGSKVGGGATQKSDPYDSKVGTEHTSTKDSSTKNINLLKHTPEELEKIVCVLDKKINISEAEKLLRASGGDVNLIKDKYEIVKAMDYENLMATMTAAIKGDWQKPIKQENKPVSKSNSVKTKFHNFEQRTSQYSPDELNEKIRRQAEMKKAKQRAE